MKNKDDKKQIKSEEEIKREIEELSKKADESIAQPLELFADSDELEDIRIDVKAFDDTADPKRSYKLYYNTQRLLKDNLPSGRKNEKLRRYVYDEKNLFLNIGQDIDPITGFRGSDGRMTYIVPFLETAFKTVSDWVADGGTAFDIYMRFRALNDAHGYHSKKVTDPSDFEYLLKGVLTIPPPKKDNKEQEK